MLSFLAVALPTLLFLPAVLLCALFPGPAKAGWRRLVGARRPPATSGERDRVGLAGDGGGEDGDDAGGELAFRAALGGPPLPGETCDRCAMAAAAAVYLPVGRLLLCGHHGRQHRRVLTQPRCGDRRRAVVRGSVGEAGSPGR